MNGKGSVRIKVLICRRINVEEDNLVDCYVQQSEEY